MSQEERVKYVNEKASGYLHDLLLKLETEEVTPDDLLATLYGGMIAAILLGYSPESMVEDAKKGAEKIMIMADEKEQSS